MSDQNFYVYVLFDANGIPRYIGKGKGRRWERHKSTDKNKLKAAFIRRTLEALGEIPKIRIREDLSGAEAFAIEIALIAAIGRINIKTGPLTNLTNGGDGFDTETARNAGLAMWASRTIEQRRVLVSKMNNAITPEQRRASGRQVGLSALTSLTPAQRSERSRKSMEGLTAEQRSINARKAGIAAAVVATKLTLEERRIKGSSGLAVIAAMTSEQRSAAGRKGNAKLTPEQRTARGRKTWETLTPEQRSEKARKASLAALAALMKLSPEERSDKARKAAAASVIARQKR